MKKILSALVAGISATAAVIYLSGYVYIFKAMAINLKKGPLTPSTDDEEKFPSLTVPTLHPIAWERHINYNKASLSEKLSKELEETRASSLVVIRDGKLLYEQYWKEHSPLSRMNSFSMAKGILSVLVGCAIDDGYLESEDQFISSVLPCYLNSKYGKLLTFRHLMTMQAGMDWKEEYHHPFAENSKQYFIDDLQEQALNIEITKVPGQEYEYQSAAAQLLGIALKKAIGRELAGYLSEKIWKPLAMERSAKWSIDEKGMEKAFCCIHATPRDFAKLGLLIMQEGNWNGKQLISKKYCRKLLTPTKVNDAFCFTLWANDDQDLKYRFFYGFLGQFIIMIPEKNMVIVKTGFYNRLSVDEKMRPHQVQILAEELSLFS